MSTNDLDSIHNTSLRMLAEIGIQISHVTMGERLAAIGYRIEAKREYAPEDVVNACLGRVPDSFCLFGRSTDCEQSIDLEHTMQYLESLEL